MTTRAIHRNIIGSIALFTMLTSTSGQCTNQSLYPGNAITPDAGGAVTTITGCSYQTEYSRITGIAASTAYRFTIADGSYITVHQGSNTGTVLGHGYSPVSVVATSTADLYPTWNVNADCSTATTCLATTVQRLLDCVPPTVTYTTENICANEEFSVIVQISDTGDASGLSFVYTINGGNVNVLSGVGLGSTTIGPFALGSVIDLTIVHGDNSDCNVVFNGITNGLCVIQGCGPDTYTHCYGNSENFVEVYQGTSGFPLRLLFNSGNVSPSGNDMLVIRDGMDLAAPILFSGVGNAGNLTGVSVISTNPDHALTLTMTSNSSFSCGDGGVSPPWNYTVSCLDCIPAIGTAGPVTTDCEAQEFTVEVTIDELGSDPEVEIANNVGIPATLASAPGTYIAGPFPVGTPVSISLVNDQNAQCTVPLGTFENGFCAVTINCDGPLYSDTYCYTNNDQQQWLYQSSGAGSLALQFTAGVIESVTWDHLAIYDGVDNTAPLLWEHNINANFNLTGLSVVGTGPALYMQMSSDASVSCSSGSFASWAWTVGCLDCTSPSATYELIPDCIHHTFDVAVTVTDLGSGSEVRLTDSWSHDTLNAVGLGTTLVGPIPVGVGAQITVLNADNQLCRTNSPQLGYPADSCIVTACENLNVEYCYQDADTAWFIYQSGEGVPVTISFNAGQLLPGDNVRLYNGSDTTAQLVFAGNLGGNIGGLALSSSNPENALTLLIVSNGEGSCESGDATPAMQWTVGCGLVGEAEGPMDGSGLFPNPTDGYLNLRFPLGIKGLMTVDVFDVTGRKVLESTFPGTASTGVLDLTRLPEGRYAVRFSSTEGTMTHQVQLAR